MRKPESRTTVQVECYAGFRYPERPRIIVWHGERLEVTTVERRSRTPSGLVFRVRTADGRRFFLEYDEGKGEGKGEWTGEELPSLAGATPPGCISP